MIIKNIDISYLVDMLASRVSSRGHDLDVRSLSPKVEEVTGLTLLISLMLGFMIRANGLPYLPSMNHGELHGGFSARLFLKIYIYIVEM